MTDILGPANGTAVTTRIAESRVFPTGDTWFKPCTTPAAQDGTQITASWLNGLMAQLRAAVRGNGKKLDGVTPIIVEDNTNDGMLLGAMQQIAQRGQTNFVQDTGAVNALAGNPIPALAEIVPGVRISVKVANTNTGASTGTFSGFGPFPIVKIGAYATIPGDLYAGYIAHLMWDGTAWELQNPARGGGIGGSIFAFATLCDFAATGYNVTYTRTTTVVTCTLANHSLRVGDKIPLSAGTDAAINGTATVASVIDANTFTIANPNGATATGSFTVRSFLIFSKNIASFVQNNDGDFTFSFAVPPGKAGYSVAGAASKIYNSVTGNPNGYTRSVFQTASTCRVSINDGTNQAAFRFINIVFVGDQ